MIFMRWLLAGDIFNPVYDLACAIQMRLCAFSSSRHGVEVAHKRFGMGDEGDNGDMGVSRPAQPKGHGAW